jgi:small-conductance mechanosensitive channel
MARLLFLLAWMVAMCGSAAADGPWSGTWTVTWVKGGAILTINQSGESLSGTYRNGQGRLTGTVQGLQFEGQINHGDVVEAVSATLGPDQNSFTGHTEAGEWLSGRRMTPAMASKTAHAVDLHSPRAALRSFLDAGNRARDGEPQMLAIAVAAVDFGGAAEWSSQAARFTATEQLFDLIDLSTFQLSTIPERTDATQIDILLPWQAVNSHLDLTLRRTADGDWHLVMPAAEDLEALKQSVGAAGVVRSADAFRQLQSPRDTLRAFLDGTSRWTDGGDVQALSTLDLSDVPEVLKNEQGRLSAQYLVRVIDRIGHMSLQSIPNTGTDRTPYVYYDNPAGRIVIEPVGSSEETAWTFSADTVDGVRALLTAIEALPMAHTLEDRQVPYSGTFYLREKIRAIAPALLAAADRRGQVEYWQLAAGLWAISQLIIVTLILRFLFIRLLTRPRIEVHFRNPRRMAAASGLILAVLSVLWYIPHLGFPTASRLYTVPLMGTVILVTCTYVCWQLIAAVVSVLNIHTARTETQLDEMLLAFVAAVARMALLIFVGLALSHLFSVPTAGILAGFGISGLAVAIASRETLSNIFGAGILLSDRPFKKGDHIVAGDVDGLVEAVGIRSTRVRTLSGNLLVVPNGKLSGDMIKNLGFRKHGMLATKLLVSSDGTPEKISAFIRDITARLVDDPLFVADATEVNISGITEYGVQIDVSTDVNTLSSVAQNEGVHRLFLDILRLAGVHGLSLGYGIEKHTS